MTYFYHEADIEGLHMELTAVTDAFEGVVSDEAETRLVFARELTDGELSSVEALMQGRIQ